MSRRPLSWRVWRVFRAPPEHHPLFTRLRDAEPEPLRTDWPVWRVGAGMALVLFFYVFVVTRLMGSTGVGSYAVALLIFLLVGAATLMISGTTPGALWTMEISRSLARQRSNGLLEMLSVTPDGGVKAIWALALGLVYHSGTFDKLYDNQPIEITWRSGLVAAAIIGVLAIDESGREMMMPFLIVGAMLAVLYLDHWQSCMVSVLVGILAGMRATRPDDARALALAAFLALQLAVYGLSVLALLWLNVIAALVTFYLCRELIISGLWLYMRARGLVYE